MGQVLYLCDICFHAAVMTRNLFLFVQVQAAVHSPSQSTLLGLCSASSCLPQGYLWVSIPTETFNLTSTHGSEPSPDHLKTFYRLCSGCRWEGWLRRWPGGHLLLKSIHSPPGEKHPPEGTGVVFRVCEGRGRGGSQPGELDLCGSAGWQVSPL